MKYTILTLFVIFIFIPEVLAQSVLNLPFNEQNYPKYNEYIKRYAPSDSALRVVVTVANNNLNMNRPMISREVYLFYKPLFLPAQEPFFNEQIKMMEQYAISFDPSSEQLSFYDKFIKERAPSEDAFVAVQRLADPFINFNKWDSAIAIFNKYIPLFPEMKHKFEKIISILEAPEQHLLVRSLGPNINTKNDEWDPCPTPDGRYLFFSAKDRKESYGQTDVYISWIDSTGGWCPPRNVGPTVNGPNDETVDNVTADGNGLLLSGDFEGTFGKFDIYYAQLTSTGWGAVEHYPFPINTQYVDEAGNLTSDGKALIFSSDRPGGIGDFYPYGTLYHGGNHGNMDIYVCLKTENGWSAPINLGPTINTPFSERAPYLHPDGKTLYFSSDGHPGMGRLDVYKSVRLKEDSWTEWSEPVNLGKEINTIADDWGYKVVLNGDSALFAAHNRTIGAGGWDIFSVTLPKESRPDRVVSIRGKVTDSKGNPLGADIKWEDLSTGKNVGILKSNPRDGSYFIVLPLGKNYGYYAEKEGYYPTSKNVDLKNTSDATTFNEDIVLYSLKQMTEEKVKVRINNIFFDYNKYELKPESYPELDRLYKILNENPNFTASIDGHTDNTGGNDYNMDLSRKRASSVSEYLIHKGIKDFRLKTKGYGSTQPIADNISDDGRAKNRRVEIWFEK